MARHWSAYVGVTERQAYALDRMAKEAGFADGQRLLTEVGSCSSSKLSKMDRPSLRALIDECFEQYGRK
jgi:hypothetical protein